MNDQTNTERLDHQLPGPPTVLPSTHLRNTIRVPNQGTFYFKYEDSDSSMERHETNTSQDHGNSQPSLKPEEKFLVDNRNGVNSSDLNQDISNQSKIVQNRDLSLETDAVFNNCGVRETAILLPTSNIPRITVTRRNTLASQAESGINDNDPNDETSNQSQLAQNTDSSLENGALHGNTIVDESSLFTISKITRKPKVIRRNTLPSQAGKSLPRPKSVPEDTIRLLVQKAEELISPDFRFKRGDKWSKSIETDNSCDASCEEDEKESHHSDDFDSSTATLKAAANSFYDLADNDNKQWLGHSRVAVATNNVMNNFSISESALHKLDLSQKELPSSSVSTNNVNTNSNNSTSSTVEEALPQLPVKETSNKKRKLRRRRLFGKSDTHLETFRTNITHLIKSVSCPGNSTANASSSSSRESDHYLEDNSEKLNKVESSAEDTDEDNVKRPIFKYGGMTRYLDSECVGNRFCLSPGEQSGSMSEQAWDNYQENYLSEPYSESQDSDAARRLLNFGEDYGKFLDSQSDWSTPSDISPKMSRKFGQPVDEDESNNEQEALAKLFEKSKTDLEINQRKYANSLQYLYRCITPDVLSSLLNNQSDLSQPSDISYRRRQKFCQPMHEDELESAQGSLIQKFNTEPEINQMNYEDLLQFYQCITLNINDIISVCDEHLSMLNQMRDSPEELKMSRQDLSQTMGLCKNWWTLKKKTVAVSQYISLCEEMHTLYAIFKSTNFDQLKYASTRYDHHTQLEQHIRLCQSSMNLLQAHHEDLMKLNKSVDQFILENEHPNEMNKSTLKGYVDNLYELFHNNYKNMNQKYEELQLSLPIWKKMDDAVELFELDLNMDDHKINAISRSLKDGKVVDQAVTIRELANLLPKIKKSNPRDHDGQEGYVSDSGISDEGSENDTRDRERKLAMIRQLFKEFNAEPTINTQAKDILRKRIQQNEEKLRNLQSRFQDILEQDLNGSLITEKLSTVYEKEDEELAPGDPDHDPGANNHRLFWRLFRTSFSFTLIILAAVCISAIIAPKCCENKNNYNWSPVPQLHFQDRPAI
ncbi:uncharacterized protein klar isoform X1 [Diabrotica undecimpunctata]|uniref:uncharacterized protein klar isoform X1 n=1 Tax=Diabrotica undecimpunctata TaxID=50387 RepID=UPI003B63294D